MKDILELETRREIYYLISRNPGLHLSKIAEILKMRTSLVEYHLLFLEKHQIITISKISGYNRYYVKGKTGSTDKKILSIIRKEIPLKIIIYLIRNQPCKHKELLEQVDISPSTLSYHLKKLVRKEIIDVKTYGENKGYSVVEREELIDAIIRYKPYSLIDGFSDIWKDLSVE